MALQTITQKHRDLRQVSIHINHYNIPSAGTNLSRKVLEEQIHGQWLDLDHFLNQFSESFSVRTKVVCIMPKGRRDMGDYIGRLLPEMKRAGAIDLVERLY